MMWKCPPLNLFNWSNYWKWKNDMNTCDTCKNYTPANPEYEPPGYKYDGSCSLMKYGEPIRINSAVPWDYEGYKAGVSIGPKFGCINWENKK